MKFDGQIAYRFFRWTVVWIFFTSFSAYAQLSVKQIGNPDQRNRNPVIGPYYAAWQQTRVSGPDALGEDSSILVYSNQTLTVISDELGENLTVHSTPVISERALAWQASYPQNRKPRFLYSMQSPETNNASDKVPLSADYKVNYDLNVGTETNENASGEITTNLQSTALGTDPNYNPDLQQWTDGSTNAPASRSPSGSEEIIWWHPTNGFTEVTSNYRNDIAPHHHGSLIAWQAARGWPFGWEIFAYDGTDYIQLTTNFYYDMGPKVSNNKVVWYGWDGQDYEIYLYDHDTRTIQAITDNNYDDVNPEIDGDIVVWEAYVAVEADIYYWTPGAEPKRLGQNIEDDLNPKISGREVVWQGFDGDDFEIYRFDGEQTIKLTSNDYDDVNPDIHDGLITWMGYEGNWDAEIFYWDGSDVLMLSSNDFEDRFPKTSNGRIIWQAEDIDQSFIFLAEPENDPL